MSDDKLHDALSRGGRARQLLDDELLSEAFKTLEEAYIAAWRITAVDRMADRENLFLAVNIIGKVKDHLASIVSNGIIAQAELNRLIDRKKRFGIL